MGPLGTIWEPLWIQVWDFRGPKGQQYENPLFSICFSGFRRAQGSPRGDYREVLPTVFGPREGDRGEGLDIGDPRFVT